MYVFIEHVLYTCHSVYSAGRGFSVEWLLTFYEVLRVSCLRRSQVCLLPTTRVIRDTNDFVNVNVNVNVSVNVCEASNKRESSSLFSLPSNEQEWTFRVNYNLKYNLHLQQ